MAYKDPRKQREAVRESVRRHREKQKGITVIPEALPDVIPKSEQPVIPAVIPNHKMPQFELDNNVLDDIVIDSVTVTPVLPACVPKILHARYAREPDYAKTIDRLLTHTLDELKAMHIWIPVWRYNAGQDRQVA